jgi:hypothetical protein
MLRKELGLVVHELGRLGFERIGDLSVQMLPSFAQQAAVSGVLYQHMLEDIDRVGW